MGFAVIGSGIVGASAAFHLAKSGHEVTLFDKQLEGKATLAGAGIICPWISRVDDSDWFTIATHGAAYYPTLMQELREFGETNTGYKETGALATSKELGTLKQLKEKLENMKEQFPAIGEIKILHAPEAKKYFPPLDENLHALYISNSARLDGRLLADALVEAFKKNQGNVVDAKVSLKKQKEKILVKTDVEEYDFDQIIVAAGAWTNDLIQPLGMTIQQEPQRGQIIHLEAEEDTSNWPVILPMDSSHYIVSFDDNRIAFGATREDGTGFDYRLTAGGIQEVLNEGLKVAPYLSNHTIREIRIGFRPMSADAKPILGKHPASDQIIIATGLGSSGLLMGPYVGTLAAKIALNEMIEIDLEPYRPDR